MNTPAIQICKLKQLASIRAGYSIRKAMQAVVGGNARLIQIKDIDARNRIDGNTVMQTEIIDLKPDHVLRHGDILLRARGENRQAALFELDDGACLAAPQFLIISVTDQRVIAEYIYWYINQNPAQSYLSRNAVGTNIPNITARVLAELPIAVPSLKKQHTIAALNRLVVEEQDLLQQKINNSRAMMNAIARQLAQ